MPNTIKKATSKKSSDVIKVEEEKLEHLDKDALHLTQNETDRLKIATDRARSAKQQRDKRREEFDELTYAEDYYANKQSANAYLRPKINDDEVRVVTGTTEKKLEVLSNEILSLNLQPEAVAYDDQDNEIRNLGQDMMDVVKRTNDIERDEDFWQDFLQELLRQRAAYLIDVAEEIELAGKKHIRIRKELLSGLRVYLGNINLPMRRFQDQPFIVLYKRYRWSEARTIYKDWDRWDFVKSGKGVKSNMSDFGYRMNDLGEDEVEELQILDPWNNEYELILNGIPMFKDPVKLPYTILPDRKYPMVATIIKSMDTDFAYGKPPVASAKTLQALSDEMIRNMIRKWRQALEPAIGVKNSANIYSKDIFQAGAVTQGVSDKDFSILNPENKGITQSEFAMTQFIEKKTEEFIGAGALQAGQSESGEQTAAEIQALQRNAIKNLGHIVSAFMRAKRDSSYIRIYSILDNFTEPVKKKFNTVTDQVENVFKQFTINGATFDEGIKGTKIVQFTDKELTEEDKRGLFEFEQSEERKGRPTRVSLINKNLLKSIPVFWHVVVNQQRREGSALDKAMFNDELKQAVDVQTITKRPINPDKVIDEFEQRWQVKGFFQRSAPQGGGLPGEERPGGAEQLEKELGAIDRTKIGSQLTEQARGATQKPALNELQKE